MERQLWFLRKAYSLAQAALWHSYQDHHPTGRRGPFFEGPQEVLFGVEELRITIRDEHTYSSASRQICLSGVTGLRNAICHPHSLETIHLDSLMEAAQQLAEEVLDDTRALRVRRLRDDLQKEMYREFEKIVQYEPLSHLPGARKWALHRQLYFSTVSSDPLKHFNCSWAKQVKRVAIPHDPAIIRAANSWSSRLSGGTGWRNEVEA